MTIWTVLWSNWFTLLITGFLSLNTAYSSGNSKKNARRSVWMNKIVLLKLMKFLWRKTRSIFIVRLQLFPLPLPNWRWLVIFPHLYNHFSQGFILFGTIYQNNVTFDDNCVLGCPSIQCVLTIYSGGFNSDRKLDEGLSFIFWKRCQALLEYWGK